jgi:hypothetical protein
MIGLFINSQAPLNNAQEAPMRLPKRALECKEIQGFVKEQFTEKFKPDMKGVRKNMENFKAAIFDKIVAKWKEIQRKETLETRALLKEIQRLRRYAAEISGRNQRELLKVSARLKDLNLAYEDMILSQLVDKRESYKIRKIRTDGKSTAWFFKKPQEARKTIANMAVDDSTAANAPRTDDESVIGANFVKKIH